MWAWEGKGLQALWPPSPPGFRSFRVGWGHRLHSGKPLCPQSRTGRGLLGFRWRACAGPGGLC